MIKKVIFLIAVLLSGCTQIKEMIFSKTEQNCSLKQDICDENFYTMKQAMDKFKADGVSYVIMNMNTSEIVDEAYSSKDGINYNKELKYSPSNLTNMFVFAGGLYDGSLVVKEIKLNTIQPSGLKKVSKETRKQYYKELNLDRTSTPLQFLQAYNYVITNEKTKDMAKILKDNVEKGAARRAYNKNLDIYGLTTTMNKSDYNPEVYTTFIGHIVKDNITYSLIAVMDNPKPLKETFGFTNAGWNVAELAGKLMANIGIQDDFDLGKE